MCTVLASGVFDIIHPGHLFFLQESKKLGTRLEVIIARDETVKQQKGWLPIFCQKQRLEIISNLKMVDATHLGRARYHEKLVEEIHPDIIALGHDQKYPVDKLLKRLSYKPQVIRIKHHPTQKINSSDIKSKIITELSDLI